MRGMPHSTAVNPNIPLNGTKQQNNSYATCNFTVQYPYGTISLQYWILIHKSRETTHVVSTVHDGVVHDVCFLWHL